LGLNWLTSRSSALSIDWIGYSRYITTQLGDRSLGLFGTQSDLREEIEQLGVMTSRAGVMILTIGRDSHTLIEELGVLWQLRHRTYDRRCSSQESIRLIRDRCLQSSVGGCEPTRWLRAHTVKGFAELCKWLRAHMVEDSGRMIELGGRLTTMGWPGPALSVPGSGVIKLTIVWEIPWSLSTNDRSWVG